jgi:PAS domain S-box-containing protein
MPESEAVWLAPATLLGSLIAMGSTTEATAHGSFEQRLEPHPSSVSEARRQVRDLLVSGEREDLLDPSLLLVSEVVTNALLHAGTTIDLAATLDDSGLRVEVGDGSPHLPSRRRYGTAAGTGRGLQMLETLVDDWGVTLHGRGKTVWFHVSGQDEEPEPPLVRRDRDEAAGRSRESVAVQLQNVPLLLHAAWQEHAEALLREYLLASLDADAPGLQLDPIQIHAEATDAIAVLEEHIPRTSVTVAPEVLMTEATEPNVSAARIEVPVPVASVAHFDTLDRAIQAALDLSEEGLVLTPPTQPEVQAFRRWLCGQVVRQAAGGRPEPWIVPDDILPPPLAPPGWDPQVVTSAGHGLIAANEESQILAVSAEAADLLGYDEAELVGRRIVSIIPERYRQAHVAGFTMYLLVGRRPLLDRVVVVPALRRDGTEIDVELTVRADAVGDGRSVFVAGIRPAR